MSWLFEAHSIWWDPLLNLDVVGKGLFLPQLNTLGFVDSSMGGLTISRVCMGVLGRWPGKWNSRRGSEGDLWLACEMNKKNLQKRIMPEILNNNTRWHSVFKKEYRMNQRNFRDSCRLQSLTLMSSMNRNQFQIVCNKHPHLLFPSNSSDSAHADNQLLSISQFNLLRVGLFSIPDNIIGHCHPTLR